jgi:hypothetical protein
MTVWVELQPTEISPNRLYPQLLLDDHVRSRALNTNDFDYAVYKEGKLFRKHADDPFPIFYKGPAFVGTGNITLLREGNYQHLYADVGNGKVVDVRRPVLGAFDAVKRVFLHFLLLYPCLDRHHAACLAVTYVARPGEDPEFEFKGRIQAFFLSLSSCPCLSWCFSFRRISKSTFSPRHPQGIAGTNPANCHPICAKITSNCDVDRFTYSRYS